MTRYVGAPESPEVRSKETSLVKIAKTAVLYTGETITDTQIQALRDSLDGRADRAAKRVREVCDIARGKFALTSVKALRAARNACADAYNNCPVRPENMLKTR